MYLSIGMQKQITTQIDKLTRLSRDFFLTTHQILWILNRRRRGKGEAEDEKRKEWLLVGKGPKRLKWKEREWREEIRDRMKRMVFFSLSMAAKEVVEPSGFIMWVHIRYHIVPLLSLLCSPDVSIVGEADSVAPFWSNSAGGDHRLGNLPVSFLFRSPSLSLRVGDGVSGPNRAVRAEIDGSVVCLTLPPIPDNKINLHSSTLMKVPRRYHLFILFSSLYPLSLSLTLWRLASPKMKIKRDCEYYFVVGTTKP